MATLYSGYTPIPFMFTVTESQSPHLPDEFELRFSTSVPPQQTPTLSLTAGQVDALCIRYVSIVDHLDHMVRLQVSMDGSDQNASRDLECYIRCLSTEYRDIERQLAWLGRPPPEVPVSSYAPDGGADDTEEGEEEFDELLLDYSTGDEDEEPRSGCHVHGAEQ